MKCKHEELPTSSLWCPTWTQGGKMIYVEKNDRPDIELALQETRGFCPCVIQADPQHPDPDTRCMCREFREQINDPEFEGYCNCGLYVKRVHND